VHRQCGDDIDYYAVQFYNQGPGYYTTAAGLVTKETIHMTKFPSCVDPWDGSIHDLVSNHGVPPEKIVVGKYIAPGDGYTGYVPPAQFQTMLKAAVAAYPTLGGAMGWQWGSDTGGDWSRTLASAFGPTPAPVPTPPPPPPAPTPAAPTPATPAGSCDCIPCGSAVPAAWASGSCSPANAQCSASAGAGGGGCYTACAAACDCASHKCGGVPSPAPPLPTPAPAAPTPAPGPGSTYSCDWSNSPPSCVPDASGWANSTACSAVCHA
jgi:hypothetical protein